MLNKLLDILHTKIMKSTNLDIIGLYLLTWSLAYKVAPVNPKEDKNSIPQCIGQSHITMGFSNMAPFPCRTRVRQTCARCAVKTIKLYDIHGKHKQVMPICTGDRTFAGETYYDGLS